MRGFIAFFLLLLSFFLVWFTSCDRKCTGCNAQESCDKGTCVCIQGFEGPNCDTPSSIHYVGNYIVNESYNPALPDGTTSANYYCSISVTNNEPVDQINFSELCPDLNIQGVYAIINTIYLVIPNQNLVNGTGTIGSNQATYNLAYNYINITYQISLNSGFTTTVSANFQHQ